MVRLSEPCNTLDNSFTLLYLYYFVHTQIKSQDGTYVSAPPVPGAVLVVVADALQDWTNNKLCKTVSRLSLFHSFAHRSLMTEY